MLRKTACRVMIAQLMLWPLMGAECIPFPPPPCTGGDCNTNTPPPEKPDPSAQRPLGLKFMDAEEYAKIPTISSALSFGAGGLPDKVDLNESGKLPVPGDQGRQGACSAWAAGYCVKTYQEAVEGNYSPRSLEQVFSPAFLYYFTNSKQGDAQECVNAGVQTIKSVLDLMKSSGAAKWPLMPYDDTTCALPPSDQAKQQAQSFKIKDYAKLAAVADIRQALAQGNPVIIGITVGANFQQASAQAWTRALYQQDQNDPKRGGHAFTIVGYDDTANTFKVMNSWGTNWGQGGFWKIAYETIDTAAQLAANRQGLLELWSVEDIRSDTPVNPDNPVPPAPAPDDNNNGPLVRITQSSFSIDENAEAVIVDFGISVDRSLKGQQITCIMLMLDSATGELLPDRDGQDQVGGFVASSGTLQIANFNNISGLQLALPLSALDLDRGSYTLMPALIVLSNAEDSYDVSAGEPFDINVGDNQVDPTLPYGEFLGQTSNGLLVYFEVDDSGVPYALLTSADSLNAFVLEAVYTDLSVDSGTLFVTLGFELDGIFCVYVGAFDSALSGSGSWQCYDQSEQVIGQGSWFFQGLEGAFSKAPNLRRK